MKKMVPFFLSVIMIADMGIYPKTHLDGPYVSYRDEQVFVKYIVQEDGSKIVVVDSTSLTNKKNILLRVNTDIPGKTFQVQLKDQLKDEEAEYPSASKLLILSDIEGNFEAFSNLLLLNGVIDTGFNWTFGNGHLVLTGDFVDRGQLVTEVLWLIYSLEDKAKAGGGYVHYILGNHEIMNMSGDLRYVNPKYTESASLLNATIQSLYNEHSELGRWLRTKNIVEKIGENLFVHGGISDQMNKLRLSIPEINKMARPYYAESFSKYPDKKLPVIFSDAGPFWYRGFYQKDPEDLLPGQLKKTISRAGVKHIFTGHSIIADTISVLFNGKLVNTDVHHAEGKSEAVLMENGKYYRVNRKGEKIALNLQ
jgi:Calcineurin-like phosphoesterase